MVSSLYLPFSFPSARDLALRSRIFLRSLSSFSLVMTTYKEINYYWLFNKTDHSLHAEDESTTFKFYIFFWSTLHFFSAEDLSNIQHVVLYFHFFFLSAYKWHSSSHMQKINLLTVNVLNCYNGNVFFMSPIAWAPWVSSCKTKHFTKTVKRQPTTMSLYTNTSSEVEFTMCHNNVCAYISTKTMRVIIVRTLFIAWSLLAMY